MRTHCYVSLLRSVRKAGLQHILGRALPCSVPPGQQPSPSCKVLPLRAGFVACVGMLVKPFGMYVLRLHVAAAMGARSRPRSSSDASSPSHRFKLVKLRDVWEAGMCCGSAERDDRAAATSVSWWQRGFYGVNSGEETCLFWGCFLNSKREDVTQLGTPSSDHRAL